MKTILITCIIIFIFAVHPANAEIASDGNISISIDIPEYISQNQIFLINLSALDISVYPVARGYIYFDALLLGRSWIYFYDSDIWNKTIKVIFLGGVGGIEWHLPSDSEYKSGQTIPLKFRAQKVTHEIDFKVVYWPMGFGHDVSAIMVGETITANPVFDPSVRITVSNGNAIVFEAFSGKSSDSIRYSEGNQQYIVNWDTSGNLPGKYYVTADFSNGYVSKTAVLLH